MCKDWWFMQGDMKRPCSTVCRRLISSVKYAALYEKQCRPCVLSKLKRQWRLTTSQMWFPRPVFFTTWQEITWRRQVLGKSRRWVDFIHSRFEKTKHETPWRKKQVVFGLKDGFETIMHSTMQQRLSSSPELMIPHFFWGKIGKIEPRIASSCCFLTSQSQNFEC